MKLKYYLRGAGIGIVFATLVMTVSALVHKYNISDEYIMKEARKLGMVMKEELKDDNLLVNDLTDDTETQVEETEDIATEDNSNTTPESESESQSTQDAPVIPDTPVSSENHNDAETQYVTITIVSSDVARQVGLKLYEAGILESAAEAETFRKYMGEHGYDKIIKAGTYRIPVGATYEEICKIVTQRN